MLDFNNILATPGADIQYFEAPAQTNLLQWQTWRKPRGAKWIYMLGVGGAGGGGAGVNTDAANSGGGAGGSSGAQAIVMIPAIFVPDLLYIQCGIGGLGATTSGGTSTAGTNTYVAIGPSGGAGLALADTFLRADGAAVGTQAASSSVGGLSLNGAATPTIGNMPLAGRGFVTLIGGQAGGAGGGPGLVGTDVAVPTTGLIVTAGAGAGGCSSVARLGGGSITTITGMLGNDFAQLPIPGGNPAAAATPATAGARGFKTRTSFLNFGGAGGGAASPTNGGVSGAGGQGAPGCGGGGGGGQNTVNSTVAPGGDGGSGFVYMITI